MILLFGYSITGNAQPSFAGLEHLFTMPHHYVACYTAKAPVIDGNISDAVWENAVWSEDFRDIEGVLKPDPPPFRTRMKMLWDDQYLYIAAEMEEPHVWAYLQQHDDIVYHDNDFEVFIDPANTAHQYFEIEFNALNTVLDLYMPKPYRNGSRTLISWDAVGLKSAVQVQGSINNPADTDKGWTVEMAIPHAAILHFGDNANLPRDGRVWRINFSRVNWHTDVVDGKYVKRKDSSGRDLPEENWVWSPQGVINMHYPERWGYLLFTEQTKPADAPLFALPYGEKQRRYLWLIYYRQKEYLRNNRKYAPTLAELGIQPIEFDIDGKKNTLTMEATGRQFTAVIESAEGNVSINDEGLVRVMNNRRNDL
jgi:hypothetical protein